jgi:hypothetical protein
LSAAKRTDLLRQACAGFAQTQAAWRAVPNPGFFSPLGFDSAGPAPVARHLAQCVAKVATLTADAAPVLR